MNKKEAKTIEFEFIPPSKVKVDLLLLKIIF